MKKDLSNITSVDDMRNIYIKKVPKMFVDYCDSGSWSESTYKNNISDFNKIKFRQKVLRDLNNRSLKIKLFDEELKMPVIIAPTGFAGMQHANGEMLAAKAASDFGIPYTLSTMSICSIEDVAGYTKKPFWFQLYMMKDKSFMLDLLKRALEANCSTLVLTADLQVLGQRHKDVKNGLSAPPKLKLNNIFNFMTKPSWVFNMLQTTRRGFGNVLGHVNNVSNLSSLSSWVSEQFDLSLNWSDIEWIKTNWPRNLIIKGIMEVDDAKCAINSGADAIIVSNHGGRQLDGAPSSIEILPEIIDAVGDKTNILLDSGIRSGQDVLRAVALGAKAVLIGRAHLYGLGAYGEQGVKRILEILYEELDITMAFCGINNINNVDKNIIRFSKK